MLKGLIFPPHGRSNEILCPIPNKKVIGFEAFELTNRLASSPAGNFALLADGGENEYWYIVSGIFSAYQVATSNIRFRLDIRTNNFSANPAEIDSYNLGTMRFSSDYRVVGNQIFDVFCRRLDAQIYGFSASYSFNGYKLFLADL